MNFDLGPGWPGRRPGRVGLDPSAGPGLGALSPAGQQGEAVGQAAAAAGYRLWIPWWLRVGLDGSERGEIWEGFLGS